MRKTFLLTSILLLSASWALAQYSSGSSQTDQQSTSGSQSTGAYSGSSAGSQTTTTDDVSPGAQPSSSDSVNQSSSDQNQPQSRGGYTSSPGSSENQGTRSESMSSQQGETSSDMGSQSGSQTGTSARTSAKATSGRTMTFQGCLSEANGKFHLTDKMGTSYELSGKTANLKSHVGHTVSVTGRTTSSGANQPGAMSGEQAGMEQTIQVSSFKHVSSSCKSGSMSSPGATGSSPHTY